MSDDEKPPLRPDVKYNRDYLLKVARDVLAASPAASLNSIAKAAQVGPGTLYRHFANREMLVRAVYRMEIQHLVDAAPVLLEQNPPLIALQKWFERLARDLRNKHGLDDALYSCVHNSTAHETRGPVILAIDSLLHACQGRRLIRRDISAADLLLLMGFMSRADAGLDDQARVARLLRLTIDGLTVLGGKKSQSLRDQAATSLLSRKLR